MEYLTVNIIHSSYVTMQFWKFSPQLPKLLLVNSQCTFRSWAGKISIMIY